MSNTIGAAILFIAILISPLFTLGQQPSGDSIQHPPSEVENASDFNAEPVESTETLALPLSRLEFQLSLCVLGFGALLILFEAYLIRSKNMGSEETIRFITVTIIIVSTLFLITAGYSNDQIAPAVGLLGTIAGYLLGRINSSNKSSDEK